MKAENLWAFSVIAAFALACALPSVEPMEAQAAQIAAPRVPTCDNMECLAGWTVAQNSEINDMDECARVVSGQAQVAGCKAFVQWAHNQNELQALVDRGL